MPNFMQMQPLQMQPSPIEDDPRMRNAVASLTRRGVNKMFKGKPEDDEQDEATDATINPTIVMRRKLDLLKAL